MTAGRIPVRRIITAATCAAAASVLLAAWTARADIGGEPSPLRALTSVRIVAGPGAEPVSGTILVRDGRIVALGTMVEIPPGAVVHDLGGFMVYPGLVESYLRLPATQPDAGKADGGKDTAPAGPNARNPRVHAARRAADLLPLPDDLRGEMRRAGFTTALVAPGDGIFRGAAAVVSLGDGDAASRVLVPEAAQVHAFEHGRWGDRTYPNSLMGAIALSRQCLHDARWHRDAWAAWREHGDEADRPAASAALDALLPVAEGARPLLSESEDLRMLPRVLDFAREFGARPIVISGASDEYRRPDRVAEWLADAGASLVLSLNFPPPPAWEGDDEEPAVELDALIHWERAPSNPGIVERAGIPFAATTQGLPARADVRARLREAIRHGLSERAALASLTTEAARVVGLADRVGTLAPGKDANFIVTDGPLFAKGTKIVETWVEGVRFGPDPVRAREGDLAAKWDLVAGEGAAADSFRVRFRKGDEGLEGKLLPKRAPGEDEPEEEDEDDDGAPGAGGGTPLTEVRLMRGVLSFGVPAREGRERLAVSARLDRGRLVGEAVPAEGEPLPLLGVRARWTPEEEPVALLSEEAPCWPPVADVPAAPEAVLVRGATVWTCAEAGVLEHADLLVVDGRIRQVGKGIAAPPGALVLDGSGRHVTPGLIDCHSHSDISGGVNESSNSCTAEVGIGDVVNPRSRAMYRELAGGLTVSSLLHGSANVIGGRNAVVKLRWGAPAEDLLFAEAIPGIKFALGENVKQSNWGDDFTTRYPQTRMGVEQFLRERFLAAEDYRRERSEWTPGAGTRPRLDLQLEVLGEILDGERLVHCHSYRADEIIMLMRVAEDFGFTIGTFQHVLEGYKCADEIAAHGAGASTFTDWWSYKYEVVDAIPYNGAVMWERGVNVSFNSDSSELSRRMNTEAAKAVKYGGVPEEEALLFVTRNPAEQLRVDEWVGSLVPGKHGDFVIWNGHPLRDATICLETWIEGVRRFARDEDLVARTEAASLREALLAKAQRVGNRLERAMGDGHQATFGARFGESLEEVSLWEMGRGECVETRAVCEEE
ncbi:MAG: amidohydrolase family protein [Gemmatimonadota bacterium]|nr:amidohydrolase family protein [Gemmatimonadota bacterium]MDP6803532.1 amidohydrolase family protein [Gemmatimonadota bacterium]MDP7032527.1 amidohydrolase family protein [Gemmatimonadota bacterium]